MVAQGGSPRTANPPAPSPSNLAPLRLVCRPLLGCLCRAVIKQVDSETLVTALENGLSQWSSVGPAGRFPQVG